MDIVRFKVDHYLKIKNAREKVLLGDITTDKLEVLQNQDYNLTVIGDDGGIIGSCGIVKYFEGRGEAWAVISSSYRQHFMTFHNAAKRLLRMCLIKRVEAPVECAFEEGHRWMKLLGFEIETPRMRCYGINGEDYAMYVRLL